MNRYRIYRIAVGILGLLGLQTAVVDGRADDAAISSSARSAASVPDHDHARAARLRGEIQPIAAILAQLAVAVPGEVIAIELERETYAGQRLWVYELKILTADGRRQDITVDARSGQILQQDDDD